MHGLSLLELVIYLMIFMTISFLALSNFRSFLMRQERELTLDRLKNAILFARNEAFRRGKTITLCGSHDQKTCHLEKEWTTGFMMFVNEHQNKQLNHSHNQPNSPADILYVFPKIYYGKLLYQTGFSGNELHIHENGMTMNIGDFIYSPKDNQNTLDNQEKLVINRACRCYRVKAQG